MRSYLSLVTFSHTIFALPFALLGYTLALLQPEHSFRWNDLLLILGCMVFARNAAMGFNRLVDAPIDAANARTAVREIPAGVLSTRRAAIFVVANALLFIGCAGLLNSLCLLLSPVALAVVLGYSYTKRFTWLCHLILGLGLALAPIGAYLAVTGSFAVLPVLYGVVVLLWVAGFDIIYALQDEGFDRSHDLHSVPTRFGASRALLLSRSLHTACAGVLILVSYRLAQSCPEALWFIVIGAGCFVFALAYQQSLVAVGRLSRVNRAFFTTNGVASVIYASIVGAGLLFA